MSHSVFSDPRLQELSGDTFKLFLWMLMQAWRFPDSDGKLRASIHFIAEALQMSPSTVSRSLQRLREDRLIELVKTDYRTGNVWAVEGVGVQQDSAAELAQNAVPQNEGGDAAKHLPAPSISESSSLNFGEQLPQFE